jgi:hypothetical protein
VVKNLCALVLSMEKALLFVELLVPHRKDGKENIPIRERSVIYFINIAEVNALAFLVNNSFQSAQRIVADQDVFHVKYHP